MRKLIRLYVLAQLVALPFALGTLANYISGDEGDAENGAAPMSQSFIPANSGSSAYEDCDEVERARFNPYGDYIEELTEVTEALYGEDAVGPCDLVAIKPLVPR